jgi:HD-like signal output (HDOD) protein/CheY-like chemotaxis protein
VIDLAWLSPDGRAHDLPIDRAIAWTTPASCDFVDYDYYCPCDLVAAFRGVVELSPTGRRVGSFKPRGNRSIVHVVQTPRVLFVDDEPAVLAELERELRAKKVDWEASFALGGERALDEVRQRPFDVVVTDMRMPGLDGDAVLQVVKNQHPATARIVLARRSDRGAVTRSLGVAQMVLAKPCPIDDVIAAVVRATRQRELLGEERLRRLVGKVNRLPSPPKSYWALTHALDDAECTVAAVVRIIESDPSMAAKLLQIANSAYFGAGRRVSGVEPAVVLLGLELVRTLALATHVFQVGDTLPASVAAGLGRIRDESFMVARVARVLASAEQDAAEAFTAGLLHDMGRIVVAATQPEAFLAVEAARRGGKARAEVERRVLGATRADIGAYLLGTWWLPEGIVADVRDHDEPSRSTDRSRWGKLAVLHAAERLVVAAMNPQEPIELDVEFLAKAGVAPKLEQWRALARKEIGR